MAKWRRGRQLLLTIVGLTSRKSLNQLVEERKTLSRHLPSSPVSNHVSITVIATVLLTGCAYQLPTVEPLSPVVAAPAPAIARFEVTPTIGPSARAISLHLRVWDETGRPSPILNATCIASSGQINPMRIVGTGSGLAEWTGAAASKGTVTCSTDGYAQPAIAHVDLSAWTARLSEFREGLDEHLRWRTFAAAAFYPIGDRFPALSRTIDWGDGAVEQLPGHIQAGPGIQSVSHVYATPGDYEVRVRVEWTGGDAGARYRLTRVCEPGPPGQTTSLYGFCRNTFLELP